jgi:SAM-dependent methyltransferase
MSAETPDYVRINRDAWTTSNARYTDGRAEEAWSQAEITWGVWRTPESAVNVLPDVNGRDVVELGCGTAYIGAWLKRRGARLVVGVDITPAQLATAERLNRWIPEAARVLRGGGELVFLRNSTLSMLCIPDPGTAGLLDDKKVQESLQRPQRGMFRFDWTDDDPGVEFHLGAGDLMRLLRANGFEILDMVELFAPEDAKDHEEYSYVPAKWARRWPSEEIWRARKRG